MDVLYTNFIILVSKTNDSFHAATMLPTRSADHILHALTQIKIVTSTLSGS